MLGFNSLFIGIGFAMMWKPLKKANKIQVSIPFSSG
jgi:hypothetical protein